MSKWIFKGGGGDILRIILCANRWRCGGSSTQKISCREVSGDDLWGVGSSIYRECGQVYGGVRYSF